ncbi:MAG: ABC transporter permease [Nitrospirae bacterium]|nr:MAG: ABC transporter permease [Nitrospirota bacterium]
MGAVGAESRVHDTGRRLPAPHAARGRHAGNRRCGSRQEPGGLPRMTPVAAIVAKELRSYFVSPIVYVVGAVFLLIFGVLSYLAVVNAGAQAVRLMQIQGAAAQLNLNDLVFRPTFYSIAIILLLILPLLTMRLFAEERKLRTFELLMTSPIGINEMVVGKFLGAYAIFLGLLGLSGIVPVILSFYSSFDWNPVLTGYLGLALLGALFLATGVLASALTENQIVAAFLSFGLLILVWLLGGVGSVLGDTPLGNILSYLSFIEHYDRFVRGLVDTKDLVYYSSGMLLMLFLAHRVVESQRWK